MGHPLSDMIHASMEQIRSMVDVNTVIGDAITMPDGLTIIPISRVSFGMGGGGADFTTKHPSATGQNPFGGGSGAGVTIQPVSFLIIKGESVRMLPIAEPASTALDRVIEMLPDLADKLSALLKKDKAEASEI